MTTQKNITAFASHRYGFSQSVAVLIGLLIALILPCACPAFAETFDSPTAEMELDEDITEFVSSERGCRENRNRRRSAKFNADSTKPSNQVSSRSLMVTQFAGLHRLANGLLAPLRC